MLLSLGAAGGVARADGATPLIIAAQNGYDSCVAILLKPPQLFPAAANRRNNTGETLAPVIYGSNTACSGTGGTAPPAPVAGLENRTSSGYTALCMAVVAGQRECVELLLSAGADVDAVDGKGRSPLYLAAAAGDTRMCGELVLHGAKPRRKNPDGVEPTIAAATRGHLATAEKIVHIARIDPELVVDGAGIPLSRYLADLRKRRGGAAAAAAAAAVGAAMSDIGKGKKGIAGSGSTRSGGGGGSGGGKRVAALLPASVARLRANGRPIASPPATRGTGDGCAAPPDNEADNSDRSDHSEHRLPPPASSAKKRRSGDNRGSPLPPPNPVASSFSFTSAARSSPGMKITGFTFSSPVTSRGAMDELRRVGGSGPVGTTTRTGGAVICRTWSGVHGGEGNSAARVDTPGRRTPVTLEFGGWGGDDEVKAGREGSAVKPEEREEAGGAGQRKPKVKAAKPQQKQRQQTTLLDRMTAFLFDVKRPGSSQQGDDGKRDQSAGEVPVGRPQHTGDRQQMQRALDRKEPREIVAM